MLLVALAAFGATRSPLLDVDAIEVEGATRTEPDAIREASGVAVGSAMTSLDPGAVEARLEALPWIAQATVARAWPSTVTITVEERAPVVVAAGATGPVLVDADGRVVATGSLDGLPEVEGDAPAPGGRMAAEDRVAIAVVAGLPADLRRQVVAATTSRRGVELELDDGIEVEWGDETQSAAKAEALRVILQEGDRPTIARIDVTVPRATTLTRNDGGQ